jgi:hypothetical protein
MDQALEDPLSSGTEERLREHGLDIVFSPCSS